MKRWLIMIGAFLCLGVVGCTKQQTQKKNVSHQEAKDYGVFLSVTRDNHYKKLKGYKTLVIDAQSFNKQQINWLQEHNGKVLSYMNVGAIESFRPYYKQYQSLTFKDYENWDEERWVDVNDKRWQQFLTQKLAKQLLSKNIDGLWLDNLDVYDFKHSIKTYHSLCHILSTLQKQTSTLIINGADTFVQQAIKEKHHYFTGINQETVFTAIDFDHHKLHSQKNSETTYYTDYLQQVKKKGYQVYLLEYTDNKKLAQKVQSYCQKKGYHYYISDSIELD